MRLADVRRDLLVSEGQTRQSRRGLQYVHALRVGDIERAHAAGCSASRRWRVRLGGTEHADLAWAYDFPTRQLLPVSGLIAFCNEKVDIVLDGPPLDRPKTHFS
jgi:uncharacterized protein (DUF427 family)